MPLSNLLRSAAGTCPFCCQKAGILSREHNECRRTSEAGWQEMVSLATNAARTQSSYGKSLRLFLAEITDRAYGDGAAVKHHPQRTQG